MNLFIFEDIINRFDHFACHRFETLCQSSLCVVLLHTFDNERESLNTMAAPPTTYDELDDFNVNYATAIDAHVACDSMLLATTPQQSPYALYQHIVQTILPWARNQRMSELTTVARKVLSQLHCFTVTRNSSPWRVCPIKHLSAAMTKDIDTLHETLRQSLRQSYARHHGDSLQFVSRSGSNHMCGVCLNPTVPYQCGLDLITRGLVTNMPNIYISSDCCTNSFSCFACWGEQAANSDMTFAGRWPMKCPFCRQNVFNLKVIGDIAWSDEWNAQKRWKMIEERICHASLLVSSAQATRDTQKRALQAKFSSIDVAPTTRYNLKIQEFSSIHQMMLTGNVARVMH